MIRLVSLLGLFILIGFAYLMCTDKKAIQWKTVISGLLIQFSLGYLILKTDGGMAFFSIAKDIATGILDFTQTGSIFMFGDLAKIEKVGFVFFTMVLPTIIFVSSLMGVFYHLGIMQKVVRCLAWFMVRLMKTSGTESLAAAANIFAGQTEAPLVVRPYLDKMTRSELLALMSGGMATVAGGVMAAYVGMGIDAGHLLAASVMSAPAALVCSKVLIPETQKSFTAGSVDLKVEKTTVNIIDAATTGATEGMKLAINVGAMLIAFVALVAFINSIIAYSGSLVGLENLSFEKILGVVFSPFALIMGIPWSECFVVGTLLGKKVVLNEFVAYIDLQKLMVQSPQVLSQRSIIIATYALCGFANISSVAIQVGGISTLIPKRKNELAKLGIKSLIAGTLACFMTACVAGLFIAK